jgi:hypothetical protein
LDQDADHGASAPQEFAHIYMISKQLRSCCFPVSRGSAKTQSSIERLQEHHTALISAAVTGNIDARSRPVITPCEQRA